MNNDTRPVDHPDYSPEEIRDREAAWYKSRPEETEESITREEETLP